MIVSASGLSTSDGAPPVPGFIDSTFSPMVVEAVRRCLDCVEPPEHTAIIIVSSSGDAAMAHLVESGARLGPLHFFQAVPSAVAGYVAARWALCGPVVCLSPARPGLRDGMDVAKVLLRDGDASAALVIAVEQSDVDTAVAVLVRGDAG